MYENGHGVPQNYTEAARWYQIAASQNNQAAQFRLGRLYAYGRGISQNFNEAVMLLNQAAHGDDQQFVASAQQTIQDIRNEPRRMQKQYAVNQLEGFAREHPIGTSTK